jgi:preprotein translocase subunit SecA
MLRLGMEEGIPIEQGMVSKSIGRAQKQVEAQNFAIRKHLLEYDDVMNKQRSAVYDLRRMILEGKNTRGHVVNLSREIADWFLESYCSEKDQPAQWDLPTLGGALKDTFGVEVSPRELQSLGRSDLVRTLEERILARYEEKERLTGPELMRFHERMIMLQIVDTQWKDHLYSLDHLKEGIGLRSYGQRDLLVEYKKESFAMFQALMDRIDEEILRWIFLYQPVPVDTPRQEPDALPEAAAQPGPRKPREPELTLAGARALPKNLSFNNPSEATSAFAKAEPQAAHGGSNEVQTVRREGKKVGRNDACPCGSGKKYKKCHGVD